MDNLPEYLKEEKQRLTLAMITKMQDDDATRQEVLAKRKLTGKKAVIRAKNILVILNTVANAAYAPNIFTEKGRQLSLKTVLKKVKNNFDSLIVRKRGDNLIFELPDAELMIDVSIDVEKWN